MSERPDIFLSYSRQDLAVAGKLAARIRAAGFEVWWDQAIPTGDTYDQVTETALRAAACVVVLWTPASVTSRWVRSEAGVAQEQGTMLPVRLAPCQLPVMFSLAQTFDLSGWTGNARDARLKALLADIGRMVTAQRQPPADETPPTPTSPTATLDRRLLIGGGVAALAAVGGGAWWWRERTPAFGTQAPSLPPSIVVLPFANLSGDPEQAWFADGVAEEIRTTLAQVPGLTVIGRASSERFRNATDLGKVAAQLGVATILTGSVRRSATTIRISAQLIDGTTGADRWSQSFDRPVGDVLDIQEEIATRVVTALSVRLSDLTGRVQIPGSRNPEARELCIKARMSLRAASSEADFRARLALLDRAIKLDPKFAEAWALRVTTLSYLRRMTTDAAAARAMQQEQLEDSRLAVRLAPEQAYPRCSLANTLAAELDLASALREAEATLRLPYNAVAWANTANVISMFDSPRAMTIQADAQANDPFSGILLDQLSIHQWRSGRFEDAIKSGQRAMALTDNNWGAAPLVCALSLAGQAKAAWQLRDKLRSDPRNDRLWATVAWQLGKRAESDAAVGRLKALDPYISGFALAVAHAQRGEIDLGCAALEQALAARCPELAFMLTDLFLNPLRGQSVFRTILAQLFPADAIAAQARRLGARA